MQGQASFGRKGAAPARSAAVPVSPMVSVPADEVAPDDEDAPVSRAPFAAVTILVFLALLFVLEMTVRPMAKPGEIGLASLMHLGAVSRDFVMRDGQVWRLLTAPWLHLNASHIIGNGVALIVIGILLEPIIGWRWFGAVYTLGGIGGGLASIAWHQKSVIAVGASGAIMAVMACAAAMSFHPASAGRRWRIWRVCAFAGVPALIPAAGSNTDYSAHAGGAFVGVLIGFALLAAWNYERRRPPLEKLVATTGVVIGFMGVCAVAAASVLPPAKLHLQITEGLIPPDEMPAPGKGTDQRWSELLSLYPQDPRAHAMAATAWDKDNAPGAAEVELKRGLDSPLLHAPEIPAGLEQRMRIMLVAMQLKQNEVYEARRTAEPLCPNVTTLDPQVQKGLLQLKVCGEQ